MRRSRTLSGGALPDLRRELRRSRDFFGPDAARRMGARLEWCLRDIAAGTAVGHRHQLLDDAPAAFLCITISPLLIIYNAQTSFVLTIVDGRRDVAAIVAQRLRGS